MARRLVAVGLAVAVALGGLWWVRPSTPPEAIPVIRVPLPPPPSVSVTGPVPRPAVGTGRETEAEEARVDALRERVGDVARQCDLALVMVCSGAECAVMGEAPDLDGPEGWVRMGWRSPRFVLSTALRDLGVPPSRLPCGEALGDLLLGSSTRQRPREDGGMVWCSGTVALCDAGARELGHGVDTFAGARELYFAR